MLKNTKLLYLISGVLTIIGLLNIFLGNILFQNINIELYDPSNDINQASATISDTLDKQSIRRSQQDTKFNANTLADFKAKQEEDTKFNYNLQDIYKTKTVKECYTLDTALNIDKCVKQYKIKLISNLKKLNISSHNYKILLNEICKYGQNKKGAIDQCITSNTIKIKTENLFQCYDDYKNDKTLKLKCYSRVLDNRILADRDKVFMEKLIDFNKLLIKVDSKGRVVTKKINSKILKEHPEFITIFDKVRPYYINIDINKLTFLNNYPDLKKILQKRIEFANNLDNFDVYKYSEFYKLKNNKNEKK